MLIANQHGNEFMVSRGMMDLIQQAAGINGPEAREIRDNLTFTIVPRVRLRALNGPGTYRLTGERGDRRRSVG